MQNNFLSEGEIVFIPSDIVLTVDGSWYIPRYKFEFTIISEEF